MLVLTAAGERLADATGDVLEAMARAQETVTEYLQTSTDTVTVTAFHSAGLAWFPRMIEHSLAEPDGPTLHCRDEDVSINEFIELVADYDIVIAHRPRASPPWPTRRLRVTPLLVEPIDLALPCNHPLATKESITLADLTDETWLAAHEGFTLEPLLVQAHAASTGRAITIAHRVNEFNVAAAIIATTPTIGLLPRYTGLPAAYRDQVVLRPIRDLTIGRHIDILTRPEALARVSIQTAIRWIRDIATSVADDRTS